MLDALKFCVGAVARKDYTPELTHFAIKNGTVRGYNGQLALSSVIDFDIDVMPKAKPLVDAVRACDDESPISMHLTQGGRLAIKSGTFRSYIECLPDDEAFQFFPVPEGIEITLNDQFIPMLQMLAPFMAIDASRPWAMGVRLWQQSAYATNNVTMVEFWHGHMIDQDIILPAAAVNELIRIGEQPTKIQYVKNNSATFWYGEDRWLRTQLIDGEWPGNIERVFPTVEEYAPITENIMAALIRIKPFLDESGVVYITPDYVATNADPELGTCIDLPCEMPLPASGRVCFRHAQLLSALEVATSFDFTNHPAGCGFIGNFLRGVTIGISK